MIVNSDDLGWSIDLECPSCNSLECLGAIIVWLPNKIGNVDNGFNSLEEAVNELKSYKRRPCKPFIID